MSFSVSLATRDTIRTEGCGPGGGAPVVALFAPFRRPVHGIRVRADTDGVVAVRIVLIEDHPALRKGLGLLLRSRGCDVVGAAGDAAGARALVSEHAPDVAVVDVHLGAESGIELTRELVERHPGTRVVLYTGSEDDTLVQDGLDAGAHGYLLKNGEIDELLDGITAAAAGRRHVDPRLRDALA